MKNALKIATILSGEGGPATVAITSASSGTVAGAFGITVTFSSDVTGFEVGDLTINQNGTPASIASAFTAVSAKVYTATITPTVIGTITVDVAADVTVEGNLAATQFSIFQTTLASPSITPTFGSELLTNGNMETGSPPSSWTAGGSATLGSEADERTGGAGSASLSVTNGAADYGYATQGVTLAAGKWVSAMIYAKKIDATCSISLRATLAGAIIAQKGSTSTSWTDPGRMTALLLAANPYIHVGNADNVSGHSSRYDDASFKEITLSSMIAKVGTSSSKSGTYQCTPTAAVSQCGMLINYADADNYVAVLVDRGVGAVRIISVIAGVPTLAKAGAFTYGAAKVLKCVVTDTTYELFYDGVSKGSATINNSALGYDVYACNPLAGNDPGTITVNP